MSQLTLHDIWILFWVSNDTMITMKILFRGKSAEEPASKVKIGESLCGSASVRISIPLNIIII